MKKTLNINLAGYPFIIDDDAYNLLKDYLDTIRYAFHTDNDTGEIAADIESRIAELLMNNENHRVKIVALNDVSKVIERIGKPSDFLDIEYEENVIGQKVYEEKIRIEQENTTSPPVNPSERNFRNNLSRKRIFRDPKNALLGGVCSGLAYYLNIDVTIVRFITVLLFFLSASTVAIVYIVMWIIVPDAQTPIQRMQMMGEDPTVENIGRTVTEKFQEIINSINPVENDSGAKNILSKIFSAFVKCLVISGIIIGFPVIIALAAALLGCVVAVFVIGIGIIGSFYAGTSVMFGSINEGLLALFIILAAIGGIIALGIPLWLLIRNFWKKRKQETNQSTQRALLILWLCGIAMLVFFTVQAVKTGKKIETQDWKTKLNLIQSVNIEEEDFDGLEMDPTGISFTNSKGHSLKITNDSVIIKKDTERTDTLIFKSNDRIIDLNRKKENNDTINN